MIRISKSSKRIAKLVITGVVAFIGASAVTSVSVAENFIGGQSYGIRKCVRAVLHGYEVKGVKIFGHKFNCKPITRKKNGYTVVNLSHAQAGLDDQINLIFFVDSKNVYKDKSLKRTIHKGISWKSFPHFEFEGVPGTGGGTPPADNYQRYVKFARDLRGKSLKPKKWESVPAYIIAVVIAELGNPENRGTAPRGVPCDLPTVYVHDNYSGSKLRLIAGPDPDLHDDGGKFADSISSICVPRGWVVRAFEHKTYKGKKLEIVGPKRYEDLKRQIGWGDRISSIAAFRQR
jgi:hypothetical protein